MKPWNFELSTSGLYLRTYAVVLPISPTPSTTVMTRGT